MPLPARDIKMTIRSTFNIEWTHY